MANEIIKRDGNNVPVLAGVTDDANQYVTMLRVDPTTKRLLVGVSSAAASLTVGTTTVSSGTTTRVLYDNAGVLGEYVISGTGSVAMTTSPTFVTPVLGVASATSLATSAASPLLLTNGQLVTITLTSQTVGGATLTIPNFAGVADEFVFKTKSVTMSNKTFIAPALGTPISGTLTNCSGLSIGNVADMGTNVATFLANPSSSNFALAVTGETGTAGGVVFSDTPTLITPVLGVATATSINASSNFQLNSVDIRLRSYHVTNFETAARFTAVLVGNAAVSYNTSGLNIDSSATSTNSAQVQWLITGTVATGNIYTGSPWFSCSFCLGTAPTAGEAYVGLGLPTVAGAAITFTAKHIGFKVLNTAGPTHTLYATQGDGSTETASSALTTITDAGGGDLVEVALHVNGTSSVDYYWRLNGGAWSAATNLTTNIPSGDTTNAMSFAVSNHATTQRPYISVGSASYIR